MHGRVYGKKAFVTGAARGLGEAMAHMLVREGAKVAVTDIDFASVEAVAQDINQRHGAGTAIAVRHDVTDAENWDHALKAAADAMGGISVLINNAGIAPIGSIEQVTIEGWRSVMSINVDSVMLGTQKALPYLREAQPASIINISSISGLIASGNLAGYNASKAAVWMLSKSTALHCARKGWDIRCNSVHPAFVQTDILRGIIGEDGDESVLHAKLARQIPLGRLGEPDDVAYAVLYLASDESRFMTGAELKLDGGISAQ